MKTIARILTRLFPPVLACVLGSLATLLCIRLGVAHAAAGLAADPGATVQTSAVDWTFWLAVAGAVLGGLSAALHVIAPRTKNTFDDKLRDDVDEALAFIRGADPKPAPALSIAPSPRDSQAGVSLLGCMISLAIGGVIAAAIACTATQARQTAAAGTVAALVCEEQHLDAATLADLERFAAEKVQAWISGKAPADLGAMLDKVKADLGEFKSDAGRCAVAGALAAATTIASPAPGTSVQGLTSAGPDPVAVRAVFGAAARELGWPSVKVAGGTVL